MVSSKTGLLSRDDKYFEKGAGAPQFRTVVNPAAKLGHECPDGCPRAQLYQGDNGLTCPECRSVFLTEEPEAVAVTETPDKPEKPEKPKAAKEKKAAKGK